MINAFGSLRFKTMLPNLSVVLGGASSGKSDIAETLVLASGGRPVYLATAEAYDSEMEDKIRDHRAARGERWRTVEAPLDAADALADASVDEVVLLDCATLWLTNHILRKTDLAAETERLFTALAAAPCPVVVVTGEVGQGIVPESPLARRFRIEQGRLNRALAARAGLVLAVMAGLPFVLKGERPECL